MTTDSIRTNAAERRVVDSLIAAYGSQKSQLELFRDQLMPALANSSSLAPHIHSLRSRLKDPDRLRDKLLRKLKEARDKGHALGITPDNLLRKINDLVGVRILHLYTRQIRQIDDALREVFDESKFKLLAGQESLTEYQFHTKTARHFFCKVCGVYPFHRKRITPDNLGINVFCLEGFDPAGIPVREAAGAALS